MTSLIRTVVLGWLAALSLAAMSSLDRQAFAQVARPSGQDILWRDDVGAGQLTTPGRSRLLPRPDGSTSTASLERRPIRANVPRARSEGRPASGSGAESDRWWNEEAKATIPEPQSPRIGRSVSPQGEIIKSTQILSMVGSEPVLACDLLGRINELLAPYAGQANEEQMEEQRWMLMERMLPSVIESKLVYLDFLRNMPPEQVEHVRSNVYEQFDANQLPALVKQAKVNTVAEFDERVRSFGSSLNDTRRSFFEQVAAREMIRRVTKEDEEITHEALLADYQQNLADYQFPAKARWEQLTTKYAKFDTEREAYQALVRMGNAILRGTPFATVAKRESQGLTAEQGGLHEWANKGSLVSHALDDAIFSMPVNEMSPILKDDSGFHIIRVVERVPAGRVSFKEAQVDIKKTLEEERRDRRIKKYLDRLKRETYVWNHFNQEAARTADASGDPKNQRR